MNPTIGFILLTHQAPAQILRLVRKLDQMFDQPPIVCHHDFNQCSLPETEFPKNVSFVRPYVRTAWADWSLIEATVRAIEQLYNRPQAPSRFVLLSGADYPLKPAAQILKDLNDGDYDVHLSHTLVKHGEFSTYWQKMAYERYCTAYISYPSLSKKLRLKKRKLALRHPLLTRPLLPFRKNLECYGGQHWLCGNERTARYIIEYHRSPNPLIKHYSKILQFSEESYFQTILANAPGLKLSKNNWRYVNWKEITPSPEILTHEDLPKLLATPAHFARKFDPEVDAKILDELDAITQ